MFYVDITYTIPLLQYGFIPFVSIRCCDLPLTYHRDPPIRINALRLATPDSDRYDCIVMRFVNNEVIYTSDIRHRSGNIFMPIMQVLTKTNEIKSNSITVDTTKSNRTEPNFQNHTGLRMWNKLNTDWSRLTTEFGVAETDFFSFWLKSMCIILWCNVGRNQLRQSQQTVNWSFVQHR